MKCPIDACKKKLGLTAFVCKCGQTFCASHRLPEDHACSFDHKGEGRAKIASENPVVISQKVEVI